MNTSKYLPVGTIVKLKDATKRLMIIGFCMESKLDDKMESFDYVGCLYPEGFIDSKHIPLFNHDQIEKIYNDAFTDDETHKFMDALSNLDYKKDENEQ